MTDVDLSKLTPEQLRAELQRREEETRIRESLARELAKNEERRKQTRARVELWTKRLQPVVDAINAARPAEFDDTHTVGLLLPAEDATHGSVCFRMTNVPEGQRRFMPIEATYNDNISVGGHGDRSTFKLRGDGTFNAAGIAKAVWERKLVSLREQQARAKAEANRTTSASLVEQLRTKHGFDKWTSIIRASERSPDKVVMRFEWAKEVSPEEFSRLVDGLKALGML